MLLWAMGRLMRSVARLICYSYVYKVKEKTEL
jgi:hypothetical protein